MAEPAPMNKMSGRTLVFHSPSTEEEYLSQHRKHVVRSWRLANMLLCFLLLCSSVYMVYAFSQISGTKTNTPRIVMQHRVATSIVLLGVGMVGVMFTSIKPFWNSLSTSALENLILLGCSIMAIAGFNLDAYYAVRLYGFGIEGLNREWNYSDSRLLLVLIGTILFASVLVPIRYYKVSWFSGFVVLTYVFALVLGSPEGAVNWSINFCCLSCTSIAITWGRYQSERDRRQLMILFLSEKTLRVQTEFKASCIEQQASKAELHSEVASENTSYQTEPLSHLVFSLQQSMVRSMQFETMQTMGQEEHWLISPASLVIHPDQQLGRGTFGVVVKGEYLGAPVAVKAPSARNLALNKLAHELRVNRHLKHPCIVTFYGAYVNASKECIILVSEFLPGGSLADRLRSTSHLSSKQIHTLLCDICAALKYMHGCKPQLVHCDVKPQNVLLTHQGHHAKLCDFGLSKIGLQESERAGSPAYMAPELFRSERAETGTDMFAFGRLVYEVVTRRKATGSLTKVDLFKLANEGRIPVLEWPSHAEDAECIVQGKVLCEMCLHAQICDRADAVTVEEFLLERRVRDDSDPDDDDRLLSSLAEALKDKQALPNATIISV